MLFCEMQALLHGIEGRPLREPAGGPFVLFDCFWVEKGPLAVPEEGAADGKRRFVQTASVKQHLKNLARAVLLRRYPILLQV